MLLFAIESSCDDTSISILENGVPISNVVSSQIVHEKLGGVVPELASREHQKNIVFVAREALKIAGVSMQNMDAIAVTIGPGLPGSLMVGASFAKGLALGLNIPIIGVNHMEAHVLSLHIPKNKPTFPYLCLVVSGGHTMLVLVKNWDSMEIIGSTQDDAVGEAFDKCAKMLGLGYPGGKLIDQWAQNGSVDFYSFPVAKLPGFDFSYSGLKTAVLYYLKKQSPEFIQTHMADICSSIQRALLQPLLDKSMLAMETYGLNQLGICGGVAANQSLRKKLNHICEKKNWTFFVPDFQYCTDNAAMIGQAAWYKWKERKFSPLTISTQPRLLVGQNMNLPMGF